MEELLVLFMGSGYTRLPCPHGQSFRRPRYARPPQKLAVGATPLSVSVIENGNLS